MSNLWSPMLYWNTTHSILSLWSYSLWHSCSWKTVSSPILIQKFYSSSEAKLNPTTCIRFLMSVYIDPPAWKSSSYVCVCVCVCVHVCVFGLQCIFFFLLVFGYVSSRVVLCLWDFSKKRKKILKCMVQIFNKVTNKPTNKEVVTNQLLCDLGFTKTKMALDMNIFFLCSIFLQFSSV